MRYTRTNGSNTVARAVPRHGSGQPRHAPTGSTSRARRTSSTSTRPAARAVTRRARGSASSPRATSRARPARTPTPARPAPSKSTTSGSPRTRSTARSIAPTTTATLDPAAPATGDTYDRSVKVNLSATDGGTNAAGVEKTEYRITTNGIAGNWTTLNNARATPVRQPADGLRQRHAPRRVPLDGQGGQHGGDQVGHLQGPAARSATARTSSTARAPTCSRAGCVTRATAARPPRARWRRRSPAGQLHLPTNDFEIDAAAAATSLGPVNFIGQDLAALGDDWQVETQFTARYTGGWQNVGLIVWKADNNFFRSTLTHSLSGGDLTSSSPRTTRRHGRGRARRRAAATSRSRPTNAEPVTIKMRYTRAAGANTRHGAVPGRRAGLGGERRLGQLPGTVGRRRAWTSTRAAATAVTPPGSRIGIIAQATCPAGRHVPVQRDARPT